jgi:hypothetical protein
MRVLQATLLTAVVAVIGICAVLWHRHSTQQSAPHNDCSVVESLRTQWSSMQRSVTQLGNGEGETRDLLHIADQEAAMSDRIKTAAASVSVPAIKEQLTKWADGAALSAKAQHGASTLSASDTGDADMMRAARLTYDATAALAKVCPAPGQVNP